MSPEQGAWTTAIPWERTLAWSVAAGLALSALCHHSRLALPTVAREVPGFLALSCSAALCVYYLRASRAAAKGRGLVWLAVCLTAVLLSGPTLIQRLSLELAHPGTLSLVRTLLQAFLQAVLFGLAAATALRPQSRAEATTAALSTTNSTSLLDGALVAAILAQIALGLALRFHGILLWPHVLVALTAVMPLAIRSGLRSLLTSEDVEQRRALPIALLLVVALQLALGILAFVVPTHVALGASSATIDLLVTSGHLVTGLALLLVSIEQAIENQQPAA